MDTARHNAVAILLAVGLVAGVAALNVAVDPLGTFGSPAIEGFNALKPGRLDREREAKLLSPEAANRFSSASIEKHVRVWEKPSDHVPVAVELDLAAA